MFPKFTPTLGWIQAAPPIPFTSLLSVIFVNTKNFFSRKSPVVNADIIDNPIKRPVVEVPVPARPSDIELETAVIYRERVRDPLYYSIPVNGNGVVFTSSGQMVPG